MFLKANNSRTGGREGKTNQGGTQMEVNRREGMEAEKKMTKKVRWDKNKWQRERQDISTTY